MVLEIQLGLQAVVVLQPVELFLELLELLFLLHVGVENGHELPRGG